MHRSKEKNMTEPLQQTKKLVSISDAAQILGVSIDTIRRWDKTGLLHSVRPDGKNRYFSIVELNAYKLSQPLSISDASYELHISPTTLRRLVKKGLIQSGRNTAGERVFSKEAIKEFLSSDYYLKKNSEGIKEKAVKKAKIAVKPVAGAIKVAPVAELTLPSASDKSFFGGTNWQLISGTFASLVIFVLLTAIGVTNIQISKVEASQSPEVNSMTVQRQPFVIPLESRIGKTKSLLNSVALISNKTAEATAGQLLRINLTDDGLKYTVETATSSASHHPSEASASGSIDAFVIDSIDSKGYHLKLPDGSLGFIPLDKVKAEEVTVHE